MKKLKFLFGKKGVISLYGVVVALIVCIMLCGYMDLTQTTHVVEEIQSIMDITALSTLQGSLDAEGVRFDRLTIRDYTYFLPDGTTGISEAERLAVNAETDENELLEALKADSEQLKYTTIWIDGTNADNVNDLMVKRIIKRNFDYYLTKLLHIGTGTNKHPLFDFGNADLENITLQDYEGNSIIKKYEIREFDANLIYDSWGVDAQKNGEFQKVPQVYLASTIVLYLNVEPTFSSMNLNIEESHVYNSLNSANSSSKLHVEGYTDDGLLAVSIRTVSRMTVQGFIASDDTPDEADLGANLDSLPFTPEEYFDITSGGVVTGFSDVYYALPQAERPTTIKMPTTIRGITPIAIDNNAFDETENDDNIVLMALPGSIRAIGKEAFQGAEYMKTFGFFGSPKLESMDSGVFKGCMSLMSFTCPTTLLEIPDYAFYGCTSMTTIKFNNALTKIGASAFENCTRLKGALDLPDNISTIGDKAFFKCDSVNKIVIPDSLTNLGSAAFGRMGNLSIIEKGTNENFDVIENVLYQKETDGTYALIVYPAQRKNPIYTIPLVEGKLVTRIGDYAFYGNKYLDTLSYYTGSDTDSEDMLHGIKTVGVSAFERCTELKTLQFAGDLINSTGVLVRPGLQTMGENAFYNTPALSLVYIDKLRDTVDGSPWGANTFHTIIKWKADDSFDWSKVYRYTESGVILGLSDYGADLVTKDPTFELIIPAIINDPMWGEVAIKEIGDNAFACDAELNRHANANSKIKQMQFTAPITSIGTNAFKGITIENFTLPDTVVTVKDYAFAKSGIVNFIVSETAESIVFGNYVFEGSSNLASFNVTYNMKDVGVGLFKDCVSLETVVINPLWIKIPDKTFSGCTKLKNVTFSSTITEIGAYAFENCATLPELYGTRQVIKVGTFAFTGCNSLVGLNFGEMIQEIGADAFFKTPALDQVYLAVEEDYVPGQPWGAESFTDIIWKNSKWVKYYEYEAAPNGTWKIIGLSPLGRDVLNDGTITDFQTPAYREAAEVVGFSMTRAEDKAALKKLTSMKMLAVKHNNGYPIAAGSFEGCTALKKIEMSAVITSIGDRTFKDCTQLKAIEIPSTVTSLGAYAFQGCTSMTQATVGAGVTNIKEYTFQGCSSLVNLGLLGAYTNIGTYAFEGCKQLPTFHIKKSCETIGDYAFYGDTKLATVTSEASAPLAQFSVSVFEGCTALESIQIPNNVKTVKTKAFYNCTGLKSLLYADASKLVTIEDEAFTNTTSLEELPTFPLLETIGVKSFYNTGAKTIQSQPKLKTIASNAFQDSKRLVTFNSCGALTNIGSYSFKGCTALQTINSHASLNTIETEAFYGCTALTTLANMPSLNTIKSYAFYNTTSLNDFTQSSVKTVETQAFRYSGIKTFTSNSITSIGNAAFNGCTRLTKIDSTSSVSIGESAFAGCTALTSLNATGVTSIGQMAFDGCTKLSSIARSDSLTTINKYAFRGSIATVLHIGSAIKTMDVSALGGMSQLSTLHMHVGEYKSMNISEHSDSTTTITNSRTNEPWGSSASVIWYNTLKVGDTTISGDTTVCDETLLMPLDGTDAQWSITVYYNGDAVNDLNLKEGSNNNSSNKAALNKFTGKLNYDASDNTYRNSATYKDYAEIYDDYYSSYNSNIAKFYWDVDNQLTYTGVTNIIINVPFGVGRNESTTRQAGKLSCTDTINLKQEVADDEIVKSASVWNDGTVVMNSASASSGGKSGETTVTFTTQDCTQKVVLNVKVTQSLRFQQDEATATWSYTTTLGVEYTGDLFNLIMSTDTGIRKEGGAAYVDATGTMTQKVSCTADGNATVSDLTVTDTCVVLWEDYFTKGTAYSQDVDIDLMMENGQTKYKNSVSGCFYYNGPVPENLYLASRSLKGGEASLDGTMIVLEVNCTSQDSVGNYAEVTQVARNTHITMFKAHPIITVDVSARLEVTDPFDIGDLGDIFG